MRIRTLFAVALVWCVACGASPSGDDERSAAAATDDTPDAAPGNPSNDDAPGNAPNDARGNTPGGAPVAPAAATVRVHYPVGSHALTVSGDASLQTPPQNVGDDTWQMQTAPIGAPISFALKLDDTLARGPSYTVAPGQTLDVYPHFLTTRGTVTTRWPDFESRALPMPDGDSRPIEVYLPPSYHENTTARYPVIYMFDGQMVMGSSLVVNLASFDMRVPATLDTSIDDGSVAEVIVVAIDFPLDLLAALGLPPDLNAALHYRNRELTPTQWNDPTGSCKPGESGAGPKMIDLILTDLKPLVDKELRSRPGRESTFVGGASLGGLMAAWTAVEHADSFAGAIALSPSAWWDNDLAARLVKGKPPQARVYTSVGAAEDDAAKGDPKLSSVSQVQSNLRLQKAYLDAGYKPGVDVKTNVIPNGTHDGPTWATVLPDAFAFVVGPGR